MTDPAPQITREEFDKRLKETDGKIISEAKSMSELITEVYGEVIDVRGYSKSTKVSTEPILVGGRNYSLGTGYMNSLEIGLALTSQEPLKKVIFHGNSPIIKGQPVRVGIFTGEKKDLYLPNPDERVHVDDSLSRRKYFVYVPRELNEQEEALYLKMVDSAGTRRIDFCADYDFKTFPREP